MDWEIVDVPTHPLGDGMWVAVIAQIRNNTTGEIRNYETHDILDKGADAPLTFIWEEGNYACDCNRRLFFGYAVGEPRDVIEHPCGEGEYSVRLLNKKTGAVYYDEMADQGEAH